MALRLRGRAGAARGLKASFCRRFHDGPGWPMICDMRTPRRRTTPLSRVSDQPPSPQHGPPHVDDRPPEAIDPADRDVVLQGLDDLRRGEIASDEDVRAAFARFRR